MFLTVHIHVHKVLFQRHTHFEVLCGKYNVSGVRTKINEYQLHFLVELNFFVRRMIFAQQHHTLLTITNARLSFDSNAEKKKQTSS